MPLVKKPMNLDETQQEIVAKLDAIKEAILGGGGSAELKIFESLEAVEAAIQSGVLKNGDAAIIKNDSVNIIGASDISAIADGTLTGAAVQLNNDIAEIGRNLTLPVARSLTQQSYDRYVASKNEVVYVQPYNDSTIADNVNVLVNGAIKFAVFCPQKYSSFIVPIKLADGDVVTVEHNSGGSAGMLISK